MAIRGPFLLIILFVVAPVLAIASPSSLTTVFPPSPSTASLSASGDCVYWILVQTGDVPKAGTDSTISLTLYDNKGFFVSFDDLTDWGIMGSGHNYFERGNLDYFVRKRSVCLTGPPCKMILSSDGKYLGSGWYCDYVSVTMTTIGQSCGHKHFVVDRWLDDPPEVRTLVIDSCPAQEAGNFTIGPREALSS